MEMRIVRFAIVFSFFFNSICTALLIDSDRDFLILFLRTVHPNAADFSSSDSPCDWSGIRCSDSENQQRIIKIDLHSNGLIGSIPEDSIGRLDGLVDLNLYNNTLSGNIPDDIWSLPNLQQLNASQNHISGSIPLLSSNKSMRSIDLSQNQLAGQLTSSIGLLSKLITLNLSNNYLQTNIPAEIFNCTLLRQLDLSHNQFSGNIPLGIGHLSQLRVLALNNNHLQSDIPLDIERLHYLQVLDLSSNVLTGSIPRLDGFRKLTTLKLSNNQLTGGISSAVFRIPSLQIFAARNNSLMDLLPQPSSSSSQKNNITVIDIGNNRLSGEFPNGIWNFSSLVTLRVDGNSFRGNFPQHIISTELKTLDVRDNTFDGEIPYGLFTGNSRLVYLDLSSNRFTGIVPDVSKLSSSLVHLGLARNPFKREMFSKLELRKVQYLNLSGIGLTGIIPSEIGDMTSLRLLDLSDNELSGKIPETIGELTELTTLDLSHNLLNGSVPDSLVKLKLLRFLDLSYNQLTGKVPEIWRIWDTVGTSGLKGNPLLCGVVVNRDCSMLPSSPIQQQEQRPSEENKKNKKKKKKRRKKNAMIAGIVTGSAVLLLCGAAVICLWCNGMRTKKKVPPAKEDKYASMSGPFSSEIDPSVWATGVREPQNIPVVMFEKPLLSLTFADLFAATSNFGKEAQVGDGPVFRAMLPGGNQIAVRILGEGIAAANEVEAIQQLEAIGRLKHPNIVPLLGYCMVGIERLLLYEYVENGSLYDKLHELPAGINDVEDWTTDTWESLTLGADVDGNELTWEARYRVALGTARALAFLHHGCSPPIVHRDVRSSNVLLDVECEPRVAEVGVMDLMKGREEVGGGGGGGGGEYGYVPPEYPNAVSEGNTKGDVYSYGVVLAEVVTGRRAIGSTGDETLVMWMRNLVKEKKGVKSLDPKVARSEEDIAEMTESLRVAYLCTADEPNKRPTMQQVVGLLKDLRRSS